MNKDQIKFDTECYDIEIENVLKELSDDWDIGTQTELLKRLGLDDCIYGKTKNLHVQFNHKKEVILMEYEFVADREQLYISENY